MKKPSPVLVAPVLLACSMASSVQAAEKELLDILLANGAITQQQYDQLLAQEELTVEDVEEVVVSLDGSGLNVESEDFEFTLGGRLHQDYTRHDYDSRMGVDPTNGTQTRRARLELDGRFHDNWGWAAEVDFQDNKVGVKDFKVGYIGEGGFSIYAGSQKQPYSLSVEMSSNDIPFMERSIDNALIIPFLDRAIGIRVEDSGDNWFFAGGVFGEKVSPGETGDESWGPSARFVYAPVTTDAAAVHLGFRAATRKTGASRTVGIADETKDYFSEVSIVDTGDIADVEQVSFAGPEIGLAWGPLLVLGEYNQAKFERDLAGDLDFNSWHLAAAWSLTGENRAAAYRMDAGEFKGFQPEQNFDPAQGQWGGWELTARYASLNMNDEAFVGGSEKTLTGGLNWYPNRNVRMMFNWTHILETDESNEVRLYAPGMDIFSLRAQYAW